MRPRSKSQRQMISSLKHLSNVFEHFRGIVNEVLLFLY